MRCGPWESGTWYFKCGLLMEFSGWAEPLIRVKQFYIHEPCWEVFSGQQRLQIASQKSTFAIHLSVALSEWNLKPGLPWLSSIATTSMDKIGRSSILFRKLFPWKAPSWVEESFPFPRECFECQSMNHLELFPSLKLARKSLLFMDGNNLTWKYQRQLLAFWT